MGKTKIEWTDETWNPVRGCRRVSAGCEHCYAETTAHRFSGPGGPYEGLTVLGKKGPRWSGVGMEVPKHLGDPLSWTRPRKVFVNSMSDLFFEAFPFDYIAAVYGVMMFSPTHEFQVLTKRPERATEFFRWLITTAVARDVSLNDLLHEKALAALPDGPAKRTLVKRGAVLDATRGAHVFPPPNVWLGVSVEDQAAADLRVPELLRLPAAIRFVSYEPALGPVDFAPWLGYSEDWNRHVGPCGCEARRDPWTRCDACGESGWTPTACNGIAWVIVGGESGRGARPFDLQWCRDTIAACRAAGVAVFAKQKGANAEDRGVAVHFDDSKGGDWNEWPEELRVREFPQTVAA